MRKMTLFGLCLLCLLSSCTFPYFYWNEKNQDLTRVRNNYVLTYEREANITFFPEVSQEEARKEGLVSSLILGIITLPISAIALPIQYPFLASQRLIDHSKAKAMVEKYFAEGKYDKVIQIDPNHIEAHYERGLVFYQRKQLTSAISDFSAAIAIGHHHKSMVKRGLAFYEQKRFSLAIADWKYATNTGYPSEELKPLIDEAYTKINNSAP
ncbi:hypothetical protein [Candidatus Uabimicrobium sp. HlEnr_7]|uniref:tetratricopeptide repeat protein n=1 Tax=Candidatus Uabimicrobium helgolandensis TaxID=3095367 RepID=UPI0035583943